MERNRLLGEILVDLGYLGAGDLEATLGEQDGEKPLLLGELLLKKGLIDERQLNQALKVSLQEVLDSSETDEVIRDSTLSSMAVLNRQFEQGSPGKLSEEGKLALLIRVEEYRSRMERLKNNIRKSLTLKLTRFRRMAIQSSKNQLIEVQVKIKKLENDINNFCCLE